jgi:lipopolysaccharide export system permease protein
LEGLEVALWRKLSDPFAVIVMCLVAIPFALATGRKGNLAPLAIAVAMGGCFWFLISGFQQLGIYGILAPPLSAVSPPLIFLAFGAFFLSRTQT